MAADTDVLDPMPEQLSIVETPRWWREAADSEDRRGNHKKASDYRSLANQLDGYLARRGAP